MLGRIGLAWFLLALGPAGCSEASQPPPAPAPREHGTLTERELEPVESTIRLSVYHACGGDAELRCQQFAPRTLRGIPPTIPLSGLACQESGAYPRRVRSCSFALGHDGRETTTCRIRLRERPGHHSPYWSDELPPPPAPPSPPGASQQPMVSIGPSSLACAGPLLALTEEPERIDPAPASPPNPITELARLISGEEYPLGVPATAPIGPVTIRLQVGSHGRIDRCTVTRTSGSEALDDSTCQLLRARAFFLPARNAAGQAVATEILHTHRWPPRR